MHSKSIPIPNYTIPLPVLVALSFPNPGHLLTHSLTHSHSLSLSPSPSRPLARISSQPHGLSKSSLFNLLPQDPFERNRIRRELGDALAQFLDGHLVLIEVEAVKGLVVEVVALRDVERLGVLCVEFLRDLVG